MKERPSVDFAQEHDVGLEAKGSSGKAVGDDEVAEETEGYFLGALELESGVAGTKETGGGSIRCLDRALESYHLSLAL